jgi:serine/threonine protein kinase
VGNNGEGKLSDFGLAIPAGVNLKKFGAKDYVYFLHLAPEVGSQSTHTTESDLYACGVTLYRLVNGDTYLPSLPPNEIRDLVVQGQFPDRKKYRDFVPRPLRALINRAIHLEPSKRFSSADQMRHALEQIVIEKNWRERMTVGGTQWTCGWGDKSYEVVRNRNSNGLWSVEVRRGVAKKPKRRMAQCCCYNVSRKRAEQHSRRVLQDFVLGRLR